MGEKYLEDEKVELKVDGFTSKDGACSSGDKLKVDPDDADDKNTLYLIEYVEFLKDKITEEEVKDIAIKGVVTTELDKSFWISRHTEGKIAMKKKLKEMYDNNEVEIGKKVKFKVVAPGKDIESDADEAFYYTVKLDSADGGFTEIDEKENYYTELERIKNNSIMWYLTKDYEPQAYTFAHSNGLTLDPKDAGGVVICFPEGIEDQEKKEAYDNNLVGAFQKAFYAMMDSVGKPTFSLYRDETTGDYYVKLGEAGSARNINVTQEILDYAMPWNYPFAFHNSTTAPDIGYLVSRLASDSNGFHSLILYVYALVPTLEYNITKPVVNAEPTPITAPHIEVKKHYQSTWYKIQTWDYQEVIGEEIPRGAFYKYVRYDPIYRYDPVYNTDGEIDHYDKVLIGHETVGVDTGKLYYLDQGEANPGDINDGDTIYRVEDKEPDSDVVELVPSLQQINHTENLNNDGIEAMDAIMKSLPDYEYDSSIKNQKLNNAQELKYYYTANEYIKDNMPELSGIKTYKYTLGGTEITKYIMGKTILNTPTNSRSIVDAVYDIYDTNENTIEMQKREEELSKDDSALTPTEIKELYDSKHDNEKDYTLAAPIVKELIAYFYNMGVLDGEEFSSVYASDMLALSGADYDRWPVNQDVKEFEYDEATNTATIKCSPGAEVVAPFSGEVTSIDAVVGEDGTITYTMTITRKIKVTIDGTEQEIDKVVVITNLKNIPAGVTVGSTVGAGQKIGESATDYITYKVIEAGEEKDISSDLEVMKEAGNADFSWPIKGTINITANFGKYPSGGRHSGMDIGVPIGTPVYAAKAGRVCRKNDCGSSYGQHFMIDHGGGYYSLYAHLNTGGILVSNGQYVEAGQLVAYSGNTR